MTDQKHSPSDVEKGEQKARERDPHGTATGADAAEHAPDASPSSDRHETETAGAAGETGEK